MPHDKFEEMLAKRFESEDKVLRADGPAFIENVDRKVTKQIWTRRTVLGSAILIGGVVTAANAPGLLAEISQYTDEGETATTSILASLPKLAPYTTAMLLAALVSTLAIISFDRA